MNKNTNIAFTLIELLVVIAIIGILSGLIIVGMSSTTQSANIAKAQIFSNSLRNSLLMNLVSEWKFDDSSSPGLDSWSSNNCTITGATSQSADCIYGNCLSFDGNDFLDCLNPNNLNISAAMTVEGWFKTSVQGDIIRKAVATGNQRSYGIYVNSSGRLVSNYSADGVSWSSVTGGTTVTNGKWNHFVASYNGINKYLYLNGKQDTAPLGFAGPIYVSTATFMIGSVYFNGYFNGSMDNIRVYNAAIPASQIKESYYAGVNKLLAQMEINKAEYAKIISNYE